MVTSPPTVELSVDASGLPIETVTVYQPSGAQVIRRLNIDLKAGTNVIQVTHLSSTTDTESFRVDGLGNARLSVVQCTLDRHPEIPKSDPIRDLTSQLEELQTEKSARRQEIKMLERFGRDMARRRDITPAEAISFSETLFDKTLTSAETVRDLDERITKLDQRINKLRDSKSGKAFTRAVVTILADEHGSAQLRLIYRVSDAYWHPLYDLYTTVEDEKPSAAVLLHYRVNLQQCTGEDWTNAKLILSTSATDILSAGVPETDNLVVMPPPPLTPTISSPSVYVPQLPCVVQPPMPCIGVPPVPYMVPPMPCMVPPAPGFAPQMVAPSSRSISVSPPRVLRRGPARGVVLLSDDSDEEPRFVRQAYGRWSYSPRRVSPPPPPKLAQTAAVISKSPVSISYAVETLTTIPSDGVSHKVLVATIPLEAAVTHITTPRKTPTAYLQCAVKNTSEYYLLPGAMSIFVDNSYVSQTDISDIATGDTFDCTLGMDTSVRVSHELTQSSVTSASSSFVEQHITTTYVSTTKLHNRHTGDHPVNIIERSSIPIASESNPRIKVFLKGPKELAESEEGQEVDLGRGDGFKVKWGRDMEDTKNGQKEGKFIWCGTIPPGEEVTLVSEWEVRAPVDAEWTVKVE